MTRRSLICAALLCIVSLGATLTYATETVRVSPRENQVHIVLSNPEAERYSGVVKVTVALEGRINWDEVPFSIDSEGEMNVEATFDSPVLGVIAVGIIEGPDPIPQ